MKNPVTPKSNTDMAEDTIREELSEREHLYKKDGTRAMREFEFYEWMKTQNAAD